MRLKSLPEGERPRERLMSKGPEALSDAELLAVLLRTGVKGKNAVELAQDLLASCGSLQKLVSMPLSRIRKTKGVGLSKALQFQACLELAKRVLASDGAAGDLQAAIGNIRAETAFARREMFYCVYLDARKRVLKVERAATGTVNSIAIHPREVFKAAFEENACSIALVHNHPSGEAEPSEEDAELARTMKQLCESLGLGFEGLYVVTREAVAKVMGGLTDGAGIFPGLAGGIDGFVSAGTRQADETMKV